VKRVLHRLIRLSSSLRSILVYSFRRWFATSSSMLYCSMIYLIIGTRVACGGSLGAEDSR
jgi:hypothetical protein